MVERVECVVLFEDLGVVGIACSLLEGSGQGCEALSLVRSLEFWRIRESCCWQRDCLYS